MVTAVLSNAAGLATPDDARTGAGSGAGASAAGTEGTDFGALGGQSFEEERPYTGRSPCASRPVAATGAAAGLGLGGEGAEAAGSAVGETAPAAAPGAPGGGGDGNDDFSSPVPSP